MLLEHYSPYWTGLFVSVLSLCMWRTGFVPFPENKITHRYFFRTYPGLRLIFQDCKIHINHFTPEISMLILVTVSHTFHIFVLGLNRFPELSRTSGLFQDFPPLQNATIKFQDFSGFPGPVQTLQGSWDDSALHLQLLIYNKLIFLRRILNLMISHQNLKLHKMFIVLRYCQRTRNLIAV